MTRTGIWIWLVLGGIAYQCTKLIFGFEAKPDQVFDCAYWSGSALALHWGWSRVCRTVTIRPE